MMSRVRTSRKAGRSSRRTPPRRGSPLRLAAKFSPLLLAMVILAPAASAQQRVRLEGTGNCAGVVGRYLATIAGGSATLVSGAAFPGGSHVGTEFDPVASHLEGLWVMSVGQIPVDVSGCVAFDKDRFTWPSDIATYVQYLAKELLAPAQRLDPSVRTLEVGGREVRLEVSRPGIDTANLSGPEGAMLGYGRLSDAERYFFLPVLLEGGDRLLVRIFRNHGQPFSERGTELLGSLLVPTDSAVTSQTVPMFELRWLDPPN